MPVAEQQMTRAQAVERVSTLERENEELRAQIERREQAEPDDGTVVLHVAAIRTGRRSPVWLQTRLTRLQGLGLRAVYDAIEGRAELQEKKRAVKSPTDAMRYLLERIALALPQPEEEKK